MVATAESPLFMPDKQQDEASESQSDPLCGRAGHARAAGGVGARRLASLAAGALAAAALLAAVGPGRRGAAVLRASADGVASASSIPEAPPDEEQVVENDAKKKGGKAKITLEEAQKLADKNGSKPEWNEEQQDVLSPSLKSLDKEPDCGIEEDDTDFTGVLKEIVSHHNVPSSELCRLKCRDEDMCGAWTWNKVSDSCVLKYMAMNQEPTRVHKADVVSGFRPKPSCVLSPDESWDEVAGGADLQDEAGLVVNEHGICLMATASGDVLMSKCDNTDKSTGWAYDGGINQLMHKKTGLCLHTEEHEEDSDKVTVQKCNDGLVGQEWTWHQQTHQILNWNGMCLAPQDRHLHGSELALKPCDSNDWDQKWIIGGKPGDNRWYYDSNTNAKTKNMEMGDSLFCVSLIEVKTEETNSVGVQMDIKAGLFQCDEFELFSSEAAGIMSDSGESVFTTVLSTDVEVEVDGSLYRSLNLPIFLAMWKQVEKDGKYKKHDWTIKLDPDTVFFPGRLKWILKSHVQHQDDVGVYLNNCKFGLRGAIEVLSRSAVKAFVQGADKCEQRFRKQCVGDCAWDEELFADTCMRDVLHVRRDNDFRLLMDQHCDEPEGWDTCEEAGHVAFHPFKDPDKYKECMENGMKHENGS